MLRARWLCSLAMSTALFGCGAAPDETEPLDEGVEERDDGVIAAWGTVYDTGGIGLNVRKAPSSTSTIVTHLAEGKSVGIACQITGDSVGGNSVWNFLEAYGGYVSDRYVWTGYPDFIPGVPKCGSSGGGSGGTIAAAAIAEARKHVGYKESPANCNKFSSFFGGGCVEWCSDFVRYAWGKAGANTSGLGQYSMTFHDYGVAKGTWKPNVAGVVVKPGDAVLWGASDFSWGAHVGMVTEVSGETFRIIHGNFDIQGNGTGDDAVYETGWVNRWNTAGTGYNILGFTSPK